MTLHKRKEEQEEGEEGGRGEGGRGGRSESVPDGAEQQQMENGGEIEGDTTQGEWEVDVVNRFILYPKQLHPAAHQCILLCKFTDTPQAVVHTPSPLPQNVQFLAYVRWLTQ